jgi:hypothetical protein
LCKLQKTDGSVFQAAHLNIKTISVPAKVAVLPQRINPTLTNQMTLLQDMAQIQRRQLVLRL